MSERVLKVALSGPKLAGVEALVNELGWSFELAVGWLIEAGNAYRTESSSPDQWNYKDRMEMLRGPEDLPGVEILERPETRLPLRTIVQGNCIQAGFHDLVLTGTLVTYEAAEDAPQGAWAIVMLTPASLAKLAAVTGEIIENPKYVFCPSELTAV